MCFDSFDDDFRPSHFRLSDFPALLFLHRPIRCRLCHERSFRLFTAKRLGIPYLWMHYALLIAILFGVGLTAWPRVQGTKVSRQAVPVKTETTQSETVTSRSL